MQTVGVQLEFSSSRQNRGLHLILDLCGFKHFLTKYMFKLLTIRMIVSQTQSGNWVMTNNVKDTYFYIICFATNKQTTNRVWGLTAGAPTVMPLGP